MIVLKASVIGNIASDPELRSSASGPPLLRFTVASNGRARSADGQRRDEVAWVQVIVLGQRAERLAPALRKGQRVFADGRLEARPWIDRAGEARAGLELVADTLELGAARQEGQRVASTPAPGVTPDDGDLDDLPW